MGAADMAQSAEQIVVTGGWPLNGTVCVPAAKNSVLPLLAAVLLCQRPVRLRGVPRLSDVECSLALLRGAGCTAQWQGSDVALSGSPVQSTLPGQTAAQMRASILFCAPLLARLGRAETVLPGGCRIGSRPIDLHLTGLARMGVQELDAGPGRLVLLAPSGLHGAEITLRFPSVGATETLLLAAACARGRTVLRGAAREPEVADLADFLNRCGGSVEGVGSSTLVIEGRRALGGCVFSPLPDRIFASTLACAAAGATVCHVDASKGIVAWGKDNAVASGLADRPIRWLVDDCAKFVAREKRRGNTYDGIIMDPPSYGRGPGGEIWKLEDCIYDLISQCEEVLSDTPLFFAVNSYTTGLSPAVMEYMLKTTLVPRFGGKTSCDEIGLPVSATGGVVPCGATAIWEE